MEFPDLNLPPPESPTIPDLNLSPPESPPLAGGVVDPVVPAPAVEILPTALLDADTVPTAPLAADIVAIGPVTGDVVAVASPAGDELDLALSYTMKPGDYAKDWIRFDTKENKLLEHVAVDAAANGDMFLAKVLGKKDAVVEIFLAYQDNQVHFGGDDWAEFVEEEGVVAGDTVEFLKKSDGFYLRHILAPEPEVQQVVFDAEPEAEEVVQQVVFDAEPEPEPVQVVRNLRKLPIRRGPAANEEPDLPTLFFDGFDNE